MIMLLSAEIGCEKICGVLGTWVLGYGIYCACQPTRIIVAMRI